MTTRKHHNKRYGQGIPMRITTLLYESIDGIRLADQQNDGRSFVWVGFTPPFERIEIRLLPIDLLRPGEALYHIYSDPARQRLTEIMKEHDPASEIVISIPDVLDDIFWAFVVPKAGDLPDTWILNNKYGVQTS
jgi:hypothetical protein